MKLIQYIGANTVIQLVFQGIFILFIIGFIIVEARAIKKQKKLYLKSLWNYLEWGVSQI